MPAYRKRSAKRTMAKKKPYSRRSKKTTRVTKSLVKRIINSCAETKYAVYSVTNYTVDRDTPVSWNLMATMFARGTTEHQFIGEKFCPTGLKFTYKMDNYVQNSTGGGFFNGPMVFNVAIVGTKTYKVATSLAISDMVDSSYGNYTADVFNLDRQKVKVLAWNKFKLGNTATASTSANELLGQQKVRYGKIWVPLRGKWQFTDFAADYQLSGYNYYLVVWNTSASNYSGTITKTGRLTGNLTVYYKDE